jgi:hypothetical protein
MKTENVMVFSVDTTQLQFKTKKCSWVVHFCGNRCPDEIGVVTLDLEEAGFQYWINCTPNTYVLCSGK